MALDFEFFNNITDFNELSSECQAEIKTDIKNGIEHGTVVEQVIDDNNNIYWGNVDWQLMVDGSIEVTINELEKEEEEEEEEKGIDYVDPKTQEYNNTLKEKIAKVFSELENLQEWIDKTEEFLFITEKEYSSSFQAILDNSIRSLKEAAQKESLLQN